MGAPSSAGPEARHLREIARLLGDAGDILRARAETPEPPAWCERRGWTRFLLGLDEETLVRAETEGPARTLLAATGGGAPESLRRMAEDISGLTAVPRLAETFEPAALPPRALVRANPRKRHQVAALAEVVRGWNADRIIDVGAGHGHLTRALAEALDRPALGLDRSTDAVAGARRLTTDQRVRFESVLFRQGEAPAAASLEVGTGDLLVGLHACGALGDTVIQHAARSGAGVMLVSCCFQKIEGDARPPLSSLGGQLGLQFDRAVLGLANLATAREGGHGAGGVMSRRETRYALALLLRGAGVPLGPGDEAQGIGRRRFSQPLAELSKEAFAARGLAPPPPHVVAEAARRASMEHGRVRRLALPRTMLARVLELAVVLDRACALPGSRVVEAFDRSASPRNLAVLREPG